MLETIFPYPSFKDEQSRIIETVVAAEHPVLIEASTGSGKTIASLTALLARKKENQKILVFVKTINQFNPVLREWARIFKHTRITEFEQPLILPLLGRMRICKLGFEITKKTILNCDNFREKNRYMKNRILDRLRRRNKRYRLLKKINWELEKEPTVTNFKNILSTRENCPYYNSRSIILQADIILMSYGYIRDHHMGNLLRELDCDMEDLHILVDEAHNFAREKFYSLDKINLEIFFKIFAQTPFLEKLMDETRGLRILDWEDITDKRELSREIWQTKNLIEKALRQVKSDTIQETGLPSILIRNGILEKLLLSMRDFFSNYNSGTLICSRDAMNVVEIHPEALFEALKEASTLVLQSGTFTPINDFRLLYGLPKDAIKLDLVERDIRIIRKNRSQFRAAYVSSISSTSRFRNQELYERFSRIITKIFDVSPSHVLVLGPSYEFIEELRSSLIDKQIPVMIETPNSLSSELHGQVLNLDRKTIILGNQNGKMLEGNEWTIEGRSIVNMVILTGLATRVPREEDELILRIRTQILRDERKALLFANQIPLSIIAKQALGRTIRHPDDRGAIIILDNRVDEYLQRSLWLLRYNRLQDLISDVREFFDEDSS